MGTIGDIAKIKGVLPGFENTNEGVIKEKTLKKTAKKPLTNYKEDRKTKKDLIDIFHIKFKERQKKESETLKNALQVERAAILNCLNKVNSYLNSNFNEVTEKEYNEAYDKLPDFHTTLIKNGFYKAVVSDVKEHGIVVSIFKNGPEKFLNEKKLLKNNGYLRGDEIYVDLEKNADGSTKIKQIDSRFGELNKKNLWNKKVFYKTIGGKIIEGKVIGLGVDVTEKQVIFQSNEGKKFPLSVENLKKGMKLASEEYKKNKQKSILKEEIKPSLKPVKQTLKLKKPKLKKEIKELETV